LWILAVTKVTLQSRFSKNDHTGKAQSIFFNGLIFLVGALILLPSLFDGPVNSDTLIFGAIMGSLSFIFQFFYITAFSRGKTSITMVINNFSMLIPMLFSVVMFNESFGPVKIAATALVIVSFFLTFKDDPAKTDGKASSRGFDWIWLVCTLIALFSGGFASCAQKWYASAAAEFQVLEFVSISYIVATLISAVAIGIFGIKEKKINVKPKRSVIISACSAGAVLGVFQCLFTYAPKVLDGTVLYPAYNCGASLLMTVVGAVFFKERCSIKQYIGIGIGAVAIVLLCL
jgi:drug/metabolite transporter (DMT)-like permease